MDDHCKPQPPSRLTTITKCSKPAYHPLGWCACFFCLLSLSISGCGRKKAPLPSTNIDSISFTSLTENVETLISDSGVTKYKLRTDLWYTYDQPKQMWYFPEGIYLEQFDTLFNIVASVKADTAYYYQSQKLWELRENVTVKNREGQEFYAVSLFWDEQNQEIYSHDPIRIIRGDGEMLESQYGFKSNQMMTKYELYSSHGHMNVKDEPIIVDSLPAPAAPLPSDSASVGSSPSRTPRSSVPSTDTAKVDSLRQALDRNRR